MPAFKLAMENLVDEAMEIFERTTHKQKSVAARLAREKAAQAPEDEPQAVQLTPAEMRAAAKADVRRGMGLVR